MIENSLGRTEIVCKTPTNSDLHCQKPKALFLKTREENSCPSSLFESDFDKQGYANSFKINTNKLKELKLEDHACKSEIHSDNNSLNQTYNQGRFESKNESKLSFSWREDIQNKATVRLIRKYLRDHFKAMNKHIIK